MKFQAKHKPTELEALLQTADRSEQARRVQALMRPTFTLAITFDARTGQVSLTNVGPEIPMQIAHHMLDEARGALVQAQAKQTSQAAPPTPPATEPMPIPPVPLKED